MTSTRVGGKSFKAAMLVWAAGAVVLASATPGSGADAQSDKAKQIERQRALRNGRPVKPAVINLAAQAQDRRDGQVLPGDPAPARSTPRYVQSQAQGALAPEPGVMTGVPVVQLAEPAPIALTNPPAATRVVVPAPTAVPTEPLVVVPVRPSVSTEPGKMFGEMTPGASGESYTQASPAWRPSTQNGAEGTAHPNVVYADERAVAETHANADWAHESAAIAVPSDSTAIPGNHNGSPRAVAAASVLTTFARIDGTGTNIRYRMLDDVSGLSGIAWTTPGTGDKINGRIEIETAQGASAVVMMGDEVKLMLSPASRVRLEKQLNSKGGTELAVELTRGEVDIQPLNTDELGLSRSPVRVRTPDKTYTTRVGLKVHFNAESGTTQQVIVPTE